MNNQAAKATDSVTDNVVEKEIDTSKVDLSALQTAAKAEMLSVVIKTEDVKLLESELEITKGEAEAMLRRNDGDVEKTLKAYIRG